MGKVVVAPSSEIQKTTVRINVNGEEIDPKTKKPIREKEPEFVPPSSSGPANTPPPVAASGSLTEIIDALARKKVESITKLVDERVVEILKESIK